MRITFGISTACAAVCCILIAAEFAVVSTLQRPEMSATASRGALFAQDQPVARFVAPSGEPGNCAHPNPALNWFDETGGKAVHTTFPQLVTAYLVWLGEPEFSVGFGGFDPGTKITDQYQDLGILFSGTDGGILNDLTGVQQEGDPNSVEDLTGYDGTYQPDGSSVYLRFQNTDENPDAPVTFTFDTPQAKVSAFIGCGVQGDDHSFTVIANDDSGNEIGRHVYHAQLWDEDPAGQNFETFFGIEAPYPVIHSVSVLNNATIQFADTLIIDNIAWSTWPDTLPGNFDRDIDVDLFDIEQFLACVTGPQEGPPATGCEPGDVDHDGDVDFADYRWIQEAFTGELLVQPEFTPSPGQSPGEKIGTIGMVGSNVYTHSGEFVEERTLLGLWGRTRMHWELTITYRSGVIYDGPLGKGWDFSQNVRLREVSGGGDILVCNGYGRQDTYTFDGPGNPYVSPTGSYDVLEKAPDGGFLLRDRYGTVQRFDERGLIESITNRTGNRIVYEHCPINGRLLRVIDTVGHEITFGWDAAEGKITSVVDPEGRTVTFGYNAAGQLEAVTIPSTPDQPAGSTITYSYSAGVDNVTLNDNLLTITDGKGQPYLENTYDGEDRVTSQRVGPVGSVSTFEYLPAKTTVTDQDGFIVDYEYDEQGFLFRTTTHTHGIRPGDPPTFVWEQEHNASGELTRITMPRGNSIEYVYDDANGDFLQHGNLLEVRNISHLPAEPPLTIHYTYEPLYNMPRTTTDARGHTITAFFDYEEATMGDLNGDGITNQAFGNVVRIELPTATMGQPASQPIVELFWFDELGNKIRQIEPDGQVITYEYYEFGPGIGQLQKMTEDFGGLNLVTEFSSNAAGDLLFQTDARGNTVTFDVNALGEVNRLIGPAPFNFETVFHYDANGNMTSEEIQNVDESGILDSEMPWIVTTYEYDILNYLTSQTEQVTDTQSVTTLYEHDADGNRTSITRPQGNLEQCVYDERDLVYQRIRAQGTPEESTTTSNYDGNRNLTTRITHEGNVHTYAYDGYDRRVDYIDPTGTHVETEYEALRLTSRVTHRDVLNTILTQRAYAYDEAGRVYREEFLHRDASGTPIGDGLSTTTWLRDPSGRPLVKTFDDNSRMIGVFDGAGRQVEMIRELAGGQQNRSVFELDALGSVLTETQHLYNESTDADDVFVNRFEYDELNRLVREERGASGTEFIEHQYNSRDLETLTIDSDGTIVRTVYDGLDREIEELTEAPNAHSNYRMVWNDNSHPVEQVDANDNVTRYTYDPMDRITRITYADNTQRFMTYDGDSRLISVINPTGTTETITPNHAGYPLEVEIAPGPGVGGVTHLSYQYNGLNCLVRGETRIGENSITTLERDYDTMANLERERQTISGAPGVVEVAGTHDGSGNRTSLAYSDGTLLEYVSDEAHRLKEIRRGPDVLAAFDYVGRRATGRQYLNATSLQATHDERMRTQSMLHQGPRGLLAGFEYAYDTDGRRKFEQRTHDLKGDAYHYDERGEFLGAKYGVPDLDPSNSYENYNVFQGSTELTVDEQQNRVLRDDDGALTAYNSPNGPYEPDALNRYYWINGIPRSHDENGNLTDNGADSFVYNSRNRIVSVPTAGVEYMYDAIGRRVRTTYPGGVMRFFYYDREHCIEERDEFGVTVATYVWGRELDDLVSLRSNGTDYYCHENALGSIALLTDAAGEPVEKVEYDAYGVPEFFSWNAGAQNWDPTPTSTVGLAYLFAGQRYDDAIDLYTGRNRTYDPRTGRFLQGDAEQGTWAQYPNRYSYGDNSNDFVNRFSPYGTGGEIATHSWTSGIPFASDPYYEHLCFLLIGPEPTENEISLFKIPSIKVKQVKSNSKTHGVTTVSGMNIVVSRVGKTVEIYAYFNFLITINTSSVCTWYTEKDPEIKKKRQRQGKTDKDGKPQGLPMKVHLSKGFIKAHEQIHVSQLIQQFQATIQAAIKQYCPKSGSFKKQLVKKLNKTYKEAKKHNHTGYPYSPTEREARQAAMELWDRFKWRWALQYADSGPNGGKSGDR